MAGHSHWTGIKHKKKAIDAKRGKVWSKCSRNIMVAVKEGGADPIGNLKLKYAIDKAKEANMPRDTIERAIKRAVGEGGAEAFEAVVYEGFGPGSVGFLVEALTDNRHRTSPEIKKLYERSGGKLAPPGSVAYMFETRGLFVIAAAGVSEEALMEVALDGGAENIDQENDAFAVTCPPQDYDRVHQALSAAGYRLESASITRLAQQWVDLDAGTAAKALRLYEALDDHDDVQNVYANFDISPDLLASLSQE